MPITVYKLRDLFWDNNSYAVPNQLPKPEKTKQFKSSPWLLDPITGNIDLYGDDWNYCLYKNNYYILKRDKCLDINKQHWRYVLVKDLWINLLFQRSILVKGDVVVWNRDKELLENFNKCLPSLENPAELSFINLKEQDFDWKDYVNAKEITTKLFCSRVSGTELKNFIETPFGDIKNKYDNVKNKRSYFKNEVYLLSYIKPYKQECDWKNRVIDLINDFLKNIKNQDVIIGKANAFPQGSIFNNKICITYSTQGIAASKLAGYLIEEIDLTGLEEIVPVGVKDGKKAKPFKQINLSEEYIVDRYVPPLDNWYAKLSRKAYLPIWSRGKENKNILKPNKGDVVTVRDSSWTSGEPQEVKFTNGTVGYLWWVDKIDFVLEWYRYSENYRRQGYITSIFFPVARDRTSYPDYIIKEKLKDKTPAIGWLMFLPVREYTKWKQFEYINNKPTKSIHYYSGLKKKVVERYEDKNQWWSDFTPELDAIAGHHVFSRMFVDLDNFTFLYWAPVYSGKYHPKWTALEGGLFGEGKFLNPNNENFYATVAGAVAGAIWHKGKIVRNNPYNETYKQFATYRETVLSDIGFQERIILPEEIRKGDYLISSMEYRWDTYKYSDPIKSVSDFSFWNYQVEYFPSWNYIGDFNEIFQHEEDLTHLNNCAVICTTPDGKIECRSVKVFNQIHTLTKSEDQIVESADGDKNKSVNYFLLKKIFECKPEIKDKKWIKDAIIKQICNDENNVIEEVIQSDDKRIYLGYDYEEEDFNSDTGNLFKLVGTKWYVFIRNKKVHLICEDEELFKKETKIKTQVLEIPDDLKNLSFLAKLNQKCILNIYSRWFLLKQKFLLTGEDKIPLKVFTITPAKAYTPADHFLVRARTQFDLIEEVITVGQEKVEMKAIAEQIQWERYHMELRRAQEDYDLSRARNVDLATTKVDTAYRRAMWDVGYGTAKSIFSSLTSIAGNSFRSIRWAEDARKFTREANKFTRVDPMEAPLYEAISRYTHPQSEPHIQELSQHYGSAIRANRARFKGRYREMYLKEYGSSDLGIGGGIANIAFSIAAGVENSRRAREDKEIATREIGLNSLSINLDHLRRKEDALVNLNSLSNHYIKPEATDLTLIKERNKIDSLGDVHLRIFTPTQQQLYYLQELRNEYGVDCYIPNVELEIFLGMPSNIVRFQKINDNEVWGIPDKLERDFLKERLMTGIKIVEVEEYQDDIAVVKIKKKSEIVILKDRVEQLEEEVSRLTEESEHEDEKLDDKRKLIKDLQDKLRLADERLRSTADKAHELEGQLAKVNEELQTCKEEPKQDLVKLNELETKITELTKQLTKAIEDKNVSENRYSQIFDQFEQCKRSLATRTAELQKNKRELVTTKTDLAAAIAKKEELDGKLLECQRALAEKPKEGGVGYTRKQLEDYGNCIRQLVQNKVVDIIESAYYYLPPNQEYQTNLLTNSNRKHYLPFVVNTNLRNNDWTSWDAQIWAVKAIKSFIEELFYFVTREEPFSLADNRYVNLAGPRRQIPINPLIWHIKETCKIPEPQNPNAQVQSLLDELDKRLTEEAAEELRQQIKIKTDLITKLQKQIADAAAGAGGVIIQQEHPDHTKCKADLEASKARELATQDKWRKADTELRRTKDDLDINKMLLTAANTKIKQLEDKGAATGEVQKQLEACNRNLDTYRTSLANKEQELTTANNQIVLYRAEIEKLKAQPKPEAKPKECLYLSAEEYKNDYKDLDGDEWGTEFNHSNHWRLTTDEFNNLILVLSYLYYKQTLTGIPDEEKQEAKQIFRGLVDDVHEKRGTMLPVLPPTTIRVRWDTLSQVSFNYLKNRAPTFIQYLKDNSNLAVNKTKNVIRSNLTYYLENLKDYRDDLSAAEFKALGRASYQLLNAFARLGTPALKLWDGVKPSARQGSYEIS